MSRIFLRNIFQEYFKKKHLKKCVESGQLCTLAPTCSRFTSVSLVLKMARKQVCPDDSNGTPAKKQKKQPGSSAKKTLTMPKSSDTGHYGDSAHKNKKIALFAAEAITKCVKEVKAVEARQKELGLAKLEQSRNQICKKYGIHPLTLSK